MPRSTSSARASISLPTNVVAFPADERTRKGAPNRTLITKPALKRFACPAGKGEAFLWDTKVVGMGLRALPSGKRSWFLQYRFNGQSRRNVLGDVEGLSPDEARAAARKLLAMVGDGKDPSQERQAARHAMLFRHGVEHYLRDLRRRTRSSTLRLAELCLEQHAKPLHATALAKLTRRDVSALHERVSVDAGPIVANRLVERLSAMLNWAIGKGHVEVNVASHVPLNPERRRDRVLSDAELRAIWHASLRLADYGRIVRLLMLTGARRDEVGGLRWDELDGQIWTIPPERMKRGIEHEVWLAPLAAAQLPRKPVDLKGRLPAFGKGVHGYAAFGVMKARLDRLLAASGCSCEPWVHHDLRRTVSTRLHDDETTPPHVVEAMLAHVSGAKAGVAGRYNHAKYREPKRAGWERWAVLLGAIVGQEPEPVSPYSPEGTAMLRRAGLWPPD